MAARAFVIAVEDYSAGNFLPSLDGCNRDAEVFIRWLLEKKLKGVGPDALPDHLRCCSGKGMADGKELEWRTAGTTSLEIIKELGRCVKDWADRTDEFYFFFSGHGFSYSNSAWEKSVDVLVASDFTDLETGGRACLPLNEIKTKLWKSLGPRHHYYFVDACRNLIPSEQLSLSGTGLGFPTSQLGTPTVYRMFSTAQNKTSDTQSGFTPLLVKGLSGGGRAKGLRSNRMYVVFDLLCEYVKQGLKPSGQDVDYEREGSGEGYILELNPIENSVCEISVEGAAPEDKFTLTVRDIKGLDREYPFSGPSFKVPLFPDEYFLELQPASGTVTRKEPPAADAVDLYDPCRISFEFRRADAEGPTLADVDDYVPDAPTTPGGSKLEAAVEEMLAGGVTLEEAVAALRGLYAKKASGEKPFLMPVEDVFSITGRGTAASTTRPEIRSAGNVPAPAPAESGQTSATVLRVMAAPGAEVQVENMKTGEVVSKAGGFIKLVEPGEYVVRLRERGVTLSRRSVTLKQGDVKTVDFASRPKDRVREAIIKAVGADTAEGASVFSEHALGPMVNADLGLWLSLFGASRILGRPGEFSRLEKLPLATFDDVKEGESVVYLLAGFEKSEALLGVGLSSDERVVWRTPREVEGLHRIYETKLAAGAGAHLLSLKVPAQPPVTFAVHCLPNRATLAAVAEDGQGRLTFHQFMLPVRGLFERAGESAQGYLSRNMLGVVRSMALAQSQFARKRSVQTLLKENDPEAWGDLVAHRWLDPLMALVAAYDVIRHGTIEQSRKLLGLLNSSLRREFEGMGDVEAIAKLIGAEWSTPSAAPLLLDGVLAFDDVEEKQMLPLAPEKLDYKSMWTAWRGAVEDLKTDEKMPDRTSS